MIPRYSRPEMAGIWSDENRFAHLAARSRSPPPRCWPSGASCPARRLAAIKEKARFDVARIDAIEKEVQHDVIAFVSNVAENVGPEGRWLHYGLTSSDVVDTALAMLMRDACDLILAGRRRASCAAVKRARLRAQAHADDRPHPRRPRRAHDLRPQARALVRRAASATATRLERARDDDRGGQALGRGGHVLAPAARGRGGGLRAAGPAARAHRVAGPAARPPRRGDDDPRPRGGQPGEVRDRDPRAAEDRGARGGGAVRDGAEGLARPCPTSATPWAASRSPASRAWCARTRWPPSRTWPSGTSATSATRRSSA